MKAKPPAIAAKSQQVALRREERRWCALEHRLHVRAAEDDERRDAEERAVRVRMRAGPQKEFGGRTEFEDALDEPEVQ